MNDYKNEIVDREIFSRMGDGYIGPTITGYGCLEKVIKHMVCSKRNRKY